MEENTSKVYVGANPLMTPPAATGAGSALFVINLCASIAPVQTGGKNLPGLENYRLYQVARVEDGRTRHRLRLGFFTSESHAESVLTVVRQQYPTAFTTSLCDEDRRFTRGYLPDTTAAASPSPKPAVAVAAPRPSVAKTPAPVKAEAPKAPAAATKAAVTNSPAATAKAKAPAPAPAKSATPAPAKGQASAEIVEVSWEPPAPAQKAPAKAATPTSVVDAEVAIDDFSWEPPALEPAAPAADKSTTATARHPVLSPVYKTQPVVKSAPAAKAAPKAEPAPTPAKADPASSMRIKAIDLTFSDPPAPTVQKANGNSSEPFHVAKGVQIGDLGISLQGEGAARNKAPQAAPARAEAPGTASTAKSVSASAVTPVAPQAKVQQPTKSPTMARQPTPETRLPDLDSTQTIRALTSDELNDDSQEKCFAIQLAASEQPVNLDAMPHLDIFEAYRLYSVATAGSGKIVHSLRLGFFKEAVSAEAVSGYLKTFFGSPTVLRISVAEQARFRDAPTAKKPAAADESRAPAKVFELNDVRAARPVVPTVTMEVPAPRTDATGSFRMNETGSFKPNATGSFKASAGGSQKVLTPTLKPAAKSAAPATKRSEPLPRKSTGATGKYKTLPRKSLSEQLLDEAREVELSQSGIRKLPKDHSLLSKLVGKLTK